MLYDLIAKEQFPKQVSLGARAVGWYENEVDEWVQNRDSAKRHPERSSSTVTDRTEAALAHQPLSKSVRRATVLDPAQAKLPAAIAAPLSTVRTASAGRTPTPDINIDGDRIETMSEFEELRLLRKENAQLKKLVGELVLKNSLLQSSDGPKASSF
jgi:hypothetical protein